MPRRQKFTADVQTRLIVTSRTKIAFLVLLNEKDYFVDQHREGIRGWRMRNMLQSQPESQISPRQHVRHWSTEPTKKATGLGKEILCKLLSTFIPTLAILFLIFDQPSFPLTLSPKKEETCTYEKVLSLRCWRRATTSGKGKQGPFCFHQAFPDDALNVRHMNVRPGGAQPALRDTMGKEGTENAVGWWHTKRNEHGVWGEGDINTRNMNADDMREWF